MSSSRLRIVQNKLPYDLAEMKSESGETLRYEIESLSSDMAIKLSRVIEESSIYQSFAEMVGSPKTILYFQKIIKNEISPLVINYCVLQWYKFNDVPIPFGEKEITIPHSGIYSLLEKIWKDKDFPLVFQNRSINRNYCILMYREFRSACLELFRNFRNKLSAIWKRSSNLQVRNTVNFDKGNIALSYVEGIDINRRCDTIWVSGSKIDHRRILVYFETPENETGDPIDEDVLKYIEDSNMRWVSLKNGTVSRRNANIWYPTPDNDQKFIVPKMKLKNPVEKWIYRTGKQLLRELNYWSSFYESFNIKIHFITGEGLPKHIAQSIAFDTHASKKGFLVGKQRSEMLWPSTSLLGHYPMDVFFTWTPRSKKYQTPNVNGIQSMVATGYPNDVVFQEKLSEARKLKSVLSDRGVTFTIALFDNMHGTGYNQSTGMMERFYLTFLNWLLEDKTLGLIIKSKKPLVLNRLPSVVPVLERAKATARCIRLEREFGRLPIDASAASNMAVGIGISTAVIESVIAGCRGIHCDLKHFRSHEFYKWGFEQIIFDDLDRLIASLKQYKENPSKNPSLGDWTPFVNDLDPFRDGQAAQRMGTYLMWAMEGFDEGKNRDEAIAHANNLFSRKWGKDKIINLQPLR